MPVSISNAYVTRAGGVSWSYPTNIDSCTKYLISITILYQDTICVSGLIFNYADGTNITIGTFYSSNVTLCFNIRGGLNAVNSFGSIIIDLLQLCAGSACVKAGNLICTMDSKVNTTGLNIVSFNGAWGWWRGCSCLQSLGITYY